MKRWFTPAEILAAAGSDLPGSLRRLNALAERKGWRRDPATARKRQGRGGGWEYHDSLLPGPVRSRLALIHDTPAEDDVSAAERTERQRLWDRFEALSNRQKEVCKKRLNTLVAVEELVGSGMARTAAVRRVARSNGVSAATLFNWRQRCDGMERGDWLAALAPEHKGRTSRVNCHADAWEFIKSDFLRPEEPSFTSCYRRLSRVAKQREWSPIPNQQALRRRLDAEVPKEVQTLARKGRAVAKTLYPHQTRLRGHLHALQAVNTDGHKFDVFVRWTDGRIVRPCLVAIQDLYSGKILSWRLSDSENKETVRLVIGDMVERHGVPDAIYLDNGRAFASKWISGGTSNRFRFKVREEEPQGLLTTLGVAIHWTTPYSGQSKPIERAFRDLADTISRHPACAGAWTGNRPDAKPENYGNAAVPLDEFRQLVAIEIGEHNARPFRRTETASGRSFDETYNASIEGGAIIRGATQAQRALWLLAADQVRTKKGSGEIEFFGNRYWSRELNAHAGKRVTVRFDPDALHQPLRVYGLDDRLICQAELVEAAGFDNAEAARNHSRKRSAYLRAVSEERRLNSELSADELARMMSEIERAEPAVPTTPKITRLVTGNTALKATPEANWGEEAEANFAAGLRVLTGGADNDS